MYDAAASTYREALVVAIRSLLERRGHRY